MKKQFSFLMFLTLFSQILLGQVLTNQSMLSNEIEFNSNDSEFNATNLDTEIIGMSPFNPYTLLGGQHLFRNGESNTLVIGKWVSWAESNWAATTELHFGNLTLDIEAPSSHGGSYRGIYIANYNSENGWTWVKSISSREGNYGDTFGFVSYGAVVASDGSIIVHGQTRHGFVIDSYVYDPECPGKDGNGCNHSFFAKFAPDGSLAYVRELDATISDIVLDDFNHIYITGWWGLPFDATSGDYPGGVCLHFPTEVQSSVNSTYCTEPYDSFSHFFLAKYYLNGNYIDSTNKPVDSDDNRRVSGARGLQLITLDDNSLIVRGYLDLFRLEMYNWGSYGSFMSPHCTGGNSQGTSSHCYFIGKLNTNLEYEWVIFSQIEVGTGDVSFRDIANHDGESILVTGSIGRGGVGVGFNFSNNVLSIDEDNQTHNKLTFVGILSENGDWQHVVDTGAISYGYNIETALKVESDTISSIYFLTAVNGTQVNVMYFDASLNLQTTYQFPVFYHTWTHSLDFMVLDHETSFLSGVLMGDVDRDNDGYNEGVSGFILFPLNSNDWDGDGVVNDEDEFPNNPNEYSDTDGDGIGDNSDCAISDPNLGLDSDGDGVCDQFDEFPYDPNESEDSDSDGIGDNSDCAIFDSNLGIDSDADGVCDELDEFPNDPYESQDSDGDGIGDNSDSCPGENDNTDVDDDGIPDGCDSFIDSDNDGVQDISDICPGYNDNMDFDLDGSPDGCDTDDDNDGISDLDDLCPGWDDTVDVDSDQIPDFCDDIIDSDFDGISDDLDQCPGNSDILDDDNDGIPDGCDNIIDSDFDNVPDTIDRCPDNDDRIDLDEDGIPDGCDNLIDSDGDMVGDSLDQCEGYFDSIDTDGDSIPDGCDDWNLSPQTSSEAKKLFAVSITSLFIYAYVFSRFLT